MRFVSFEAGGGPRLGVLDQAGRVADVTSAAPNLLAVIDGGDEVLARVRAAAADPGTPALEMASLRLLAPLDPPRGNVLCIGRNYAAHAAEAARAWGQEAKPPTIFTKAQTSINSPNGTIRIPAGLTEKVDWEVELGVVLGRPGRDISAASALEHVFGYTVVNDVSARDIQNGWGGQFFKGKSLDGFCPVGPVVVTADEVPDPQALRLKCVVNGVVKQDASTADMIYSVADIIEWASRGMTLPAGTLIATGTPDGVGFAREPAEFLKAGDLLESTVEGIGTLSNRFE